MSRKRPREIVVPPVLAAARTEDPVTIEIPVDEQIQNGGDAANGTNNGSSNGATQKRFSSICIDDDGMEMGSSDNFWPPNPDSLQNGLMNYGE